MQRLGCDICCCREREKVYSILETSDFTGIGSLPAATACFGKRGKAVVAMAGEDAMRSSR